MQVRKHFRLLVIASLAWFVFWIAGLPDYYQQYSQRFMIWFVILLLPPLELIIVFVLKRVSGGRRMSISLWLAFYFTVPLIVYDWIYCGLYRGHGLGFLADFWYLTVYYIVPWLFLPVTAIIWNQREAARASKSRYSTPG